MLNRRPAVIAHVIDSLEVGGTQLSLVNLLEKLESDDARHVVVTMRGAGSLAAELADHVACRSINATGRSRTAFLPLAGALRDIGADLVHARNTGVWKDAILASLLLPSCKLVLGFHGFDTTSQFSRRQRWTAKLGWVTGARFVSNCHSGKRLLGEFCRIPPKRVDVLTNGVDLQRFHTDTEGGRCVRQSLGIGPADMVVGMVGSLTPIKRHEDVIRSMASIVSRSPSIHLLVVGDGSQREVLEELARELGLADRMTWCGERDDVARLLNAMDLFVCASAYEGMSNAVLEAMAVGLPIVATDVGDNRILVRNMENGIVVPPKDQGSLVAAIEMLGSDEGLRSCFGNASRRLVERFDIERMVAGHRDYYSRHIRPFSQLSRGRLPLRREVVPNS